MTTLDWQDGQPFSSRFGDVYFSRESGLDETRHVYLRHNQLAERFAALAPGEHFTIAENGFGTGLNFLAAWQLWQQTAPAGAFLHFVSTEAYPLSKTELQQALAAWPELASLAAELTTVWEDFAPGFHRLHPGKTNLTLTLLIGDANETLPRLDAMVDAWFLDGFAPSKNPQMWSDTILEQVGRLTKPGGTFATFTSAGSVRRGLKAQGFDVKKVPGHGPKREMSAGYLQEKPAGNHGWVSSFRQHLPLPARQEALVIGGGMAGSSIAHSLARRGWQITLIEARDGLARAASGNAAGVLYARLAPKMGTLAQLILGGLQYSQRWVQQWLPQDTAEGTPNWRPCGVIQLAFNEEEAERIQGLTALGLPDSLMRQVSAAEASQIAGIPQSREGLFYPKAGWVHPPALCQHATTHPHIRIQTHTRITRLQREGDEWQAFAGETLVATAPVVILASANECLEIMQTSHLPVRTLKGQVSYLPATAASRQLNTVICAEGYLAPARDNQHAMGATFEPRATDLTVTQAGHLENLATLKDLSDNAYQALQGDQLVAELTAGKDPAGLGGRAAYRAVTPDYTPIIGPVADIGQIITPRKITQPLEQFQVSELPWLPGLFTSVAHGTRGLITAPLAGEILAAHLMHEPCPVPSDQLLAVQPARFPIKPNPVKRQPD
ncbi:bifunctional tRNA (5-methylaminomethyl-2-thiouridine)(34)-methyltransferase MnmD/FAD-dependent 5-carboxymethylaminomethyl-2-thiouridine(34) oxidoreductase MnmC [Leeia oryzae]|uniref:bifunctional tRNA (5-methylaminomethyl-2-thiouridine)(34)-methyltransferase MnmD/FAD-dependent 5-carboxymethylaminomethyl-2-thiouridine(34) oxidoreductase MnmC n=1 Tax=Leeia oryzae TaxID=356662 RepID=UPI0003686D0D|nr:bifunctional tRNA (5-methylaminomethyl-2-thiouridine)(34)-methyltransferase MnmD/FAD-dependent 5-carboxymethylaminomethyl-2-thiouridine(34) oxidoreductase MnmC [Leeia oryzae]